MEKQNFYDEQLIGVDELNALQNTPNAAIKEILTSLANAGVLTGFTLQPTQPAASLGVVVKAGKVCLTDGAFVVQAGDSTLDLSGTGVVAVAGKFRWVSIFAKPKELSDTPVVTPGGAVIQYRIFDTLEYELVAGAEHADPVRPAIPAGRILIGDVKKSFGQATILVGDLDISRQQKWVDIPTIINMIQAGHTHEMGDVNGLEGALDGKSNAGHNHGVVEVVGLVDLLALKANVVHSHKIDDTTDLSRLLFGGLDLSNFNGKMMQIKAADIADNEFVVPHTLGRMPMGFIVVGRSGPGDLYGLPVPASVAYVDLGSEQLVVGAKNAPWLPSGVNADKWYGKNPFDGFGPVMSAKNLVGGDQIVVNYLGGTVRISDSRPYVDANGQAPATGFAGGTSGRGFPTKHMDPNSMGYGACVGAFFDINGKVVKAVPVGRVAQYITPAGGVRFGLGVNDDIFGDNIGSFTMLVAGVGAQASTPWDANNLYFRSSTADTTYLIYVL